MRFSIKTLGCRANQADEEKLSAELCLQGFSPVSFEEEADIYILNTCTVTHQADSEARSLLRQCRRKNPKSLVIVTGCYAQVSSEELKKMGEVDWVVGNVEKVEIARRLKEIYGSKISVSEERRTCSLHSRAYVKIQDGCNFRCSFCIIPFARGKSRSRDIEEIIAEMKNLRNQGTAEAVLTGIHIASFGWDLKPQKTLFDLMESIAAERPIGRVRLSTLDPDEVTCEMIDLMAEDPIFCSHLHLAIQSGVDSILEKMRRRHRYSHLVEVLTYAKERLPDVNIGCDLICGFPGESEADHQETYRRLSKLPLDYIHAFPYSERKGTAAAGLPDSVLWEVRQHRVRDFVELSARKKELFYQSQLGKRKGVVLERPVYGTRGMTDNYIPVHFEEKEGIPGMLLPAILEKMENGKVVGQWDRLPVMRKSA